MAKSLGRVKACNQCRQQKVRCDAYRDYSQPCSRCQEAKIPCVTSSEFQRRQRQTKAQLQHELNQLKTQVQSFNELNIYTGPTEPVSQSMNATGQPQSGLQSMQLPESTFRADSSLIQNAGAQDQHQPPALLSNEGQLHPTAPRSLGDFRLEGSKIDDCHHLFMSHYAPYLKNLIDNKTSPNEHYQHCPLLFWSITYVGSRRYTKDPTISYRLGPLVTENAFTSLFSPVKPIPVILAAIILCNWPMPVDLVIKDPSPSLAGAAMNLAIQYGLHRYQKEQDFVNTSREKPPESSTCPASGTLPLSMRSSDVVIIHRTCIWLHCLVAFQSANLANGLPPPMPITFRDQETCTIIASMVDPLLAYRVRILKIVTEATNVVSSNLDPDRKTTESLLSTIVSSYDERLQEQPPREASESAHFTLCCGRLWVLGFHLLNENSTNYLLIIQLYGVARDVIIHLAKQNETDTDVSSCLPHWYARMIFFATHLLLRICKSPLKHKIDMEEAEETFFAGVNLLRKQAVVMDDLYARNTVMLTQLWSSSKAFVRGHEEPNGLYLDIRDRLSTSPAFDNFWWWRKEFGNPISTNAVQRDYSVSQTGTATSGSDIARNLPLSDAAHARQLHDDCSLTTDEGELNTSDIGDDLQSFSDWNSMAVDGGFETWSGWQMPSLDSSLTDTIFANE